MSFKRSIRYYQPAILTQVRNKQKKQNAKVKVQFNALPCGQEPLSKESDDVCLAKPKSPILIFGTVVGESLERKMFKGWKKNNQTTLKLFLGSIRNLIQWSDLDLDPAKMHSS